MPAAGKLEPDDVITAIDGNRVRDPRDVFTEMSERSDRRHRALHGAARQADARRAAQDRALADAAAPRRSSASSLEPALDIHLPFQVRIDAGNVGGPSAGLAFALEVLAELGRDVVHGHKIAATGEIFPDGSVGPIGGIKQKTIGAREAGVDAFLVPAGENARDARKARGRAPDHPCGELSTGVARAGDTARSGS